MLQGIVRGRGHIFWVAQDETWLPELLHQSPGRAVNLDAFTQSLKGAREQRCAIKHCVCLLLYTRVLGFITWHFVSVLADVTFFWSSLEIFAREWIPILCLVLYWNRRQKLMLCLVLCFNWQTQQMLHLWFFYNGFWRMAYYLMACGEWCITDVTCIWSVWNLSHWQPGELWLWQLHVLHCFRLTKKQTPIFCMENN